ncbi:tail fiber domain-containing protein [Salinimonas marina]|uniref:Tail fiber domain-containing protein n=1 Tax=Salinimonas marina TaxID=2785918 RepID=A0A7S9DZU7_9ALTE|nr:tail fiber domain-containing protein [Salinimonas marina]QPG06968.1 tail fiber domain-containing protein [Salinimonas marina]
MNNDNFHVVHEVSPDEVVVDENHHEIVVNTANPTQEIGDTTHIITIQADDPVSLYQPNRGGDGYFTNTDPDTTVFSGGVAERGFTQVRLSWIELNVPPHHSHTEILRATVNDPAAAIPVGTSLEQAYVDTVEPGQSYFYWLQGFTHFGESTPVSDSIPAASSTDQAAILQFLGLDEVVNELVRLEADIDAYGSTSRLYLDELAAQNLSEALKLINDTILTVNANLVQIEETLGLASSTAIATLNEQISILLTDSEARVAQINALTAQMNSETTTRTSEISRIDSVLVTTDAAISTATEELTALIQGEGVTRAAALLSERKAAVTREGVIASAVDSLSASVQEGLDQVDADISLERSTRATEHASLAQQIFDISTGFDTAHTSLDARITNESTARSNADTALASDITALTATVNDGLNQVNADVDNRFTVMTSAYDAYADSILTLEANYQGITDSVTTTNAALNQESITRADADSALTTSLNTLESSYNTFVSSTNAAIYEEQTTRADADQVNAQAVTDLSAKMDSDIGTALASAKDHTNASVGYCTIAGELTTDTDKTTCEANGGTWVKLPLAQALDQVSISFTDSYSQPVTGTVGSLFEVMANELNELDARAFFGLDINNRITGLVVTDGTGNQSVSKVDLIGSQVNILHDDTMEPFVSFDTVNRRGVIRGQLILTDGTTITDQADIQGADGSPGAGFYTIVNSNGVFPANSTATNDYTVLTGHAPINHTHLTYTNEARTASQTRRFDGISWVEPTLVVNGDALVLGTITSQHIVTGAVQTDHLASKAITAEKVDVTNLFAQNIDISGRLKSVNGVDEVVISGGGGRLIDATVGGETVFRVGSGTGLLNGTWILPASIYKDSLSQEVIDFILSQVGTSTGGVRSSKIKPILQQAYPLEALDHGTSPITVTLQATATDSSSTMKAQAQLTAKIYRDDTLIRTVTGQADMETYNESEPGSTTYVRGFNMYESFEDFTAPDNGTFVYKVVFSDMSADFPSNNSATFSVSEDGAGGGSGGGSGGDATTLDGLDSTQFLRSDISTIYQDNGGGLRFVGSANRGYVQGLDANGNNGELWLTGLGGSPARGITLKGDLIYVDGLTETVKGLMYKSPVNSSAAVSTYINTNNWLQYRFGGTSDVVGMLLTNYDTETLRLLRNGDIEMVGDNPEIRFQPRGANDYAGIRVAAGSGNDGYFEFWTSDDYNEPFVWRSYDVGNLGTGSYREWMKLDQYGLTLDGGTNTTLTVLSDDSGESVLNLIGSSQGTGRVYVGQSLAYGGGFEYNGDGAPSSSSPLNDRVSFFRRSNGVNTEVMSYYYNGGPVTFTEHPAVGDDILMTQKNKNGYYGLMSGSTDGNWVRTTANGLIPYQSGGTSALGTSGWPFHDLHTKNGHIDELNTEHIELRSGGAESNIDIVGSSGQYGRVWYRDSDNRFGFYLHDGSGISTRLYWRGDLDRWTYTGEAWGPDFIATSDRRIKSDIRLIGNALAKVDQLNGYTYHQDQLGQYKAGLIAQELEAVLPESVTTSDEGEKLKSISLSGPVALLVEAVKEIKAKVDAQQRAIDQWGNA